ncbi:MAG: hypothetical protein KKH75_02100 [Actinobacteria bacterium]|nr:hypothetical protein [Actinomycetota bacterium]
MSEGGHAVSTEDDGDELAVLRHRAYAPDADIEADPRALARLQQLEERVRARHADSAAGWSPSESASERAVDVATGPATEPVAAQAHPVLRRTDAADPGTPSATDPAAPPSSDPAASDPPSPDAAAPRHTRARRRWIAAAVAVALAAAGLAAWGAIAPGISPAPVDPTPRPVSPLAGDPSARVLVELPIDAAPPTPLDQTNPPGFPVPEGLAWTSSYGTTYGWELWIARTQSGIPCLAVRRGTDVIANCAVVDPFGPDGVDVLVPYAAMPREDLPEGMTPGQSLAFWWPAGDSVLIAVGIAG